MKLRFFALFNLLFFTVLFLSAQDVASGQKPITKYDRTSLTVYYMKFPGENHSSEIESKISSLTFPDKFDNNNLDQLIFRAPYSRTEKSTDPKEAIRKYLNEQNVGKNIINKWYNRKNDGTMDAGLVQLRGMYNATDADYLKANADMRGDVNLKDYGFNLINLSYILVIDIENVTTEEELVTKKKKESVGWSSLITAYLYKIKYTKELQDSIFNNCWIYPEDTPDRKAEKNRKYDQLKIPIEFVFKSKKPFAIVTSKSKKEVTIISETMDQLLTDMVQGAYDESLYRLEMKIEDFKVKVPLFDVRPLTAKIGKKEGLKCDNRYFAYEYVFKENTNSTIPKQRGVVRATSKIVDNRVMARGNMDKTRFYQTAGRELEPGYLLKQANDIGIEYYGGVEAGEVGGFYARVDYRLGRLYGLQSQFIYLDLAMQRKEYDVIDYGAADDFYVFTRVGLGLAQGFMLTRNIEIRPFIGGGVEMVSKLLENVYLDNGYNSYSLIDEDKLKDYTGPMSFYGKAGLNLAFNLRHNIQLTGGASYFMFLGNAFVLDKDSKPVDAYFNFDHQGAEVAKWSDLFQNRKGISTMLGLRIGF